MFFSNNILFHIRQSLFVLLTCVMLAIAVGSILRQLACTLDLISYGFSEVARIRVQNILYGRCMLLNGGIFHALNRSVDLYDFDFDHSLQGGQSRAPAHHRLHRRASVSDVWLDALNDT